MSSTDWNDMTNSLASPAVLRGVTGGHAGPSGGGTFVFGMRSTTVVGGALVRITNQANFAPVSSGAGTGGGSIRGALQRATSGGASGFQPFLFIGAQDNDLSDPACLGYMLGLTDGDPHHIVLVKGPLVSGCPDAAPGTVGSNVLRRSTETFPLNTWLHLRLDMRCNANGDTVLICKRNAGSVASPVWDDIPGMDTFIDDALGANCAALNVLEAAELPFVGGYLGYGARLADTNRAVYFDQIECMRET